MLMAQTKTLISARLDNQLLREMDGISKATRQSRSWLIEQAIGHWLASNRPVGPAGWATGPDLGADEAADQTLARILNVTVSELEAARIAAMQPETAPQKGPAR